MRQHATQELRTFEAMIKSELDSHIDALLTEKAEKMQSIVDFQTDLRTKIQQLQHMVAECDDKAGNVARRRCLPGHCCRELTRVLC